MPGSAPKPSTSSELTGTWNVPTPAGAPGTAKAKFATPTAASGSVGGANATFHVSAGETVTCTFTNTKRGHIIIDKVTVPGADPQQFTFTPSYNGGQTFQLADATAPNDSGALVRHVG